MILIILHHFACHGGGYIVDSNTPMVNQMLIDLLIIGGKVGVNIHIMISGYYLINGRFKWSKFAKIIFEVFAYSIVIYAVFLWTGKINFDATDFVHNFFPIIFNRYWFVTAYVIVYLLSPFINKMLKALTQKEHISLIAVLLVLQCILKLFTQNFFSDVGWFITVYNIGAYIKLYPNKWLANKAVNSVAFAASYLMMFLAETFTSISLYKMTGIVCVIASISLFNLFAFSKNNFSSKFINLVASTTFGIYLIHDNSYVRGLFMEGTIKMPTNVS